MSKRIFISKNASEVDSFRSQFEELGYSVISHSFLSFSAVEFEVEHSFDVIFFGSPRSVIFYLANGSLDNTKLIGCVGGKTAELLESLGLEVGFVGIKSGDPRSVAEDFKVWLDERRTSALLSLRVLFPVSDRSLRTVSSEIDDSQREEVIVYSTKTKGKVIEACDVYVFTSPSNVEGFLELNTVTDASKVIAWGKSTESSLVSGGVEVEKCLGNSSLEELLLHV